jgi:hypothetical protein
LPHPFEELGGLWGIRFEADTTTSPDGSAGFFNHRWPIRVYLQSKLWARDGRLRFIQTICHEFWKYSGKCIAGLATALGRVHRRGLIHKELAKTRTGEGAIWRTMGEGDRGFRQRGVESKFKPEGESY